MRKLLLLPVVAVALAAAGPAYADDANVAITATGFTPASVTVQNGDRVVWTNNDTKSHRIVADDGSFRSRLIVPGTDYAHVFSHNGTFAYHDAAQPARRGTVVVTATRAVSMSTEKRVVTFNRSVLLTGSISSGKAGEEVVIQQKAQGSDIFLRATTVTTTDNGLWSVSVRPRRNTVYRAVWNNIPSAGQTVFVRPLLKLRRNGGTRFAVGIYAQVKFRFRAVLIQRWSLARHRWFTIKITRPTIFQPGATQSVSIAVFRLKARPGTVIRALLPRSQAAPAYYGPASSRSLRV